MTLTITNVIHVKLTSAPPALPATIVAFVKILLPASIILPPMEISAFFATLLTATNVVQIILAESAIMDSSFILYNLQLESVKNVIHAMLITAKPVALIISAKHALLDIQTMLTEHVSFVPPLAQHATQTTLVQLVKLQNTMELQQQISLALLQV